MTRFNALQIKFDKDHLNSLTTDPDSGVCKHTHKYHIALHPAQFTDFGQSIKDELGRKIARYDDLFGGIMLGYENIKLQSDLGVIGLDNCYVHMDIQADFFIFKPEIGMVLKGIVTRTTKDHVGCLVYSTFNISLPKVKDEDGEDWLGNKVGIQSEVQFKIIYVDLDARLPYIRGQLLSILKNSDISLPLSPKKGKAINKKINFDNLDEELTSPPKPRKKKKNKDSNLEDSLGTVQLKQEYIEAEEDPVEEIVKKSKKHKKKQENGDAGELYEEEEIIKQQKHKKKKRKENNEADRLNEEEIIMKKEKRKEKKRRQEQNDLDISLESLDLKSIFDNVSVDLNDISQGQMANSDDKKKRRRSNSVSHKISLENVKLEEDSEMEKIISAKKRKRSSSVSQELNLENVKLEEGSEMEKIMSGKKRKRSSSVSQELNLENVKLEECSEMEKILSGKKRRSSSVSQELNLENVKLEEGSKMEKIMSGKKRRRSSSVSQELNLENVKLEECSEMEKILSGKKRRRSSSVSQELNLESVKLEQDGKVDNIPSGKKRKKLKSTSN